MVHNPMLANLEAVPNGFQPHVGKFWVGSKLFLTLCRQVERGY